MISLWDSWLHGTVDASRAADKKLLITSNENRHGTDEIAAGHRVGTAIIMPR